MSANVFPSGANVLGTRANDYLHGMRSRPLITGALVGLIGTCLFAFLATEAMYTYPEVRAHHLAVWRVYLTEATYHSTWVLFGPVIVLLGSRYRIETGHISRLPIWVAASAAAGVGQALYGTFVHRVVGLTLPGVEHFAPTLLLEIGERLATGLAATVLLFTIGTLFYHVMVYYTAYRDREAELARFQLQVLRAQLQPHFLFNTLNTVSALMIDDVPEARRVLVHLADLLRISLDQMGRQHVRVDEELDFLERYLDIQRSRFGDRFTVDWSIDRKALKAWIPSMVLQPCVENAIRHGIERRADGGQISIGAHVDDGRIVLEVADNGPGAPTELASSGTGLVNIRARLQTLYGERQSVEAGNAPVGGYRVRITVPLADS